LAAIAGIVNLNIKAGFEIENVRKMLNSISHRGKGTQKIKNCGNGIMGCSSFVHIEDKEKQLPISLKFNDEDLTICFDGLIYNTNELKRELKIYNSIDEEEDAQLVLAAYAKWGTGCLHHLNGIFAFSIWNAKRNELFLARDRFGIKPLYYTKMGDILIFSSEIKGILAHKSVSAIIDSESICEVIGLGPAHAQGTGVFCRINEVLPAHCCVFNRSGFHSSSYWSLTSKTYTESFETCLNDVKELTINAINSQLELKNRNIGYFLSGGLDSSIITALASKKYGEGIDTFSLKYIGNDEYFSPTEYQPTSDDYYINLMSETFGTKHHVITVDNQNLYDLLFDAMKARDLPGMGDIDSSLYFLCREIGHNFDGGVSGECADEVFGGYPWFHRQEDFEANTFPWSKNIQLRMNLINPDIMNPDRLSNYISSKYNQSISKCPVCRDDNAEEKRRREISHLNLNWFMYSLGTRSERIGMNCGLEIRMPFCDYKLVEYLWNVPWKFKAYNEREKGLLRMCFEDILPQEILWRKKSPFPKTHNPEYESIAREQLKLILEDKNSRIHDIINYSYINNLLKEDADYGKPWFGQLMALPQLYAYLIQVEMWLKEYNIKIKL
jgi:asparagine synthase (glutamine-hydrolysing)